MNITNILRASTIRRILLILLLALLGILLAIFPAWSTITESREQMVINANEVINDDVYLAGENVTIDGTIKGDAVLAGRKITINGTVEGDLLAAGQAIIINGTVKDDARIAGQVLQLGSKARVGDGLMASGASLENQAGSTVGGNLYFGGAQALLAGKVERNVVGGMNSLDLRGTVGGNMTVTAIADPNVLRGPFAPNAPVAIPPVPIGLTLGDSAQVSGKLTYKSLTPANISQNAQIKGGVVQEQLPPEFAGRPNPVWIVISQLQRLLTLILIGWLMLRFVPTWTQSLAATVQTRPLASLGWGIISFLGIWAMMIVITIAASILATIFAFTLPNLILPTIGLGILANLSLVIGFLIFASYVPQIILSFLGGQWLLHKIRLNVSNRRFTSLIIGLVVFVILTAIPVFGDILSLIIIFAGLGALWILWRSKGDRLHNRQLILDTTS
jgi:cytoskeletal protein CcmA (bactofilin family)